MWEIYSLGSEEEREVVEEGWVDVVEVDDGGEEDEKLRYWDGRGGTLGVPSWDAWVDEEEACA